MLLVFNSKFYSFHITQIMCTETQGNSIIVVAMDKKTMHIAMFPWFAMGHFTPFLHLSNKLAERGHRVSFFIPRRSQSKVQNLNLHPHLITFFPITLPHVDGLPLHAETTSDVPFSLYPHLATAMDRTEKEIGLLLKELNPQIVFFDWAYWLPNLARSHGIKCLQYMVVNPATVAYGEGHRTERDLTEADLMKPPPGFPDPSINFHAHEARFVAASRKWEFGSGVRFTDRFGIGTKSSDAIGFRGCREIEGPYVDYLETIFGKPILLSGPLLPELTNSTSEEKWASWLGGFKPRSVVYCAFGSESPLQQNQFQELLLGLELTGFPFLAALAPPIGFESIEEALPQGFKERVQGRGIAYGGWVQQRSILGHPSVGCFVTHCGASSISEGLLNECQLVFLPRLGSDHVMNARVMSRTLKVGVEVEKDEEEGFFTKESVCKAVKIVMDDENEVGREVKENHTSVRNLLLSDNLESSCVDNFCQKLQELL